MEFFERFEGLVQEKGVNLTELSRDTGIPRTTLMSFSKKKQKYTSMKNAKILADYFGKSLEWIITGKEIAGDGKTLEISPLKSNLIDQITALDEEKVKMLNAFMQSIKEMK